MSGVGGIGGAGAGGAMGIDRVLQMRQEILARNEALSRANTVAPASGFTEAKPATFAATLENALKDVNQAQHRAGELSAAYERGETVDIAKVMLARQEASVGFEATLQVRNKLLSAYQNIMNMPV